MNFNILFVPILYFDFCMLSKHWQFEVLNRIKLKIFYLFILIFLLQVAAGYKQRISFSISDNILLSLLFSVGKIIFVWDLSISVVFAANRHLNLCSMISASFCILCWFSYIFVRNYSLKEREDEQISKKFQLKWKLSNFRFFHVSYF